jgi:organic hydroperoxide reductase OsmC/OhrA
MDTIYTTEVHWIAGHEGEVLMGNGPRLPFSAPPDAHGMAGVLTPEDAFVAAVNSCVMLMFLWACERLKIDLVAYDCHAAGTKHIELDHTEIFSRVLLQPRITVRGTDRSRVERALQSARKYSLIANSIKGAVEIEPEIICL